MLAQSPASSHTFDPYALQRDFPILQRQIHEQKRLVYLDNGATSQKPQAVIDAIVEYYQNHNANVHRGIHQLGDESTKLFHGARRTIAKFFGAEPEEFIAVRNTTEAINQVVYTWGEQYLRADDVMIISEMEHHSNLVPWQELAKRKNLHLLYVDVDEHGRLDLEQLLGLIREHGAAVKLVSLVHVSNAVGTLNPLLYLIQEVKKLQPGVRFLIDGAQAAPHLQIDFHDLDADFYTVSAHKMLGPMGMGGLFVKKALLEQLPPFLFGGGMIQSVSTDKTTYAEDLEERFTAGTPDVAGLVGWAAACTYISQIGWTSILKHDQKLVQYALSALQRLPQIKMVGPVNQDLVEEGYFAFDKSVFPLTGDSGQPFLDRVGSVAFIYEGVHAHDVGQILDSEGVAVRSGHHCTMPLHTKFHWTATVRASFQVYNTEEDIDALIVGLQKVQKIFGK